MPQTNIDKSQHYGALQQVVDQLFGEEDETFGFSGACESDGASAEYLPAETRTVAEKLGFTEDQAALLGLDAFDRLPDAAPEPAGPVVSRLQVVLAAEAADLPDDLMRIVNLLPPGEYTRQKLTTQLNSAITGHAWGQVYGTVS